MSLLVQASSLSRDIDLIRHNGVERITLAGFASIECRQGWPIHYYSKAGYIVISLCHLKADGWTIWNGGRLSIITPADLESALTGNPEALEVHLTLVERDVSIDGHLVKIHCHCLSVDGNGRVQPHRLAEFMRNAVVDYAIPRSKLADAKARDSRFNSTEAVAELIERAKRSFTDLTNTGEGGEMLLFLLAERFLKLPQILCKMDLKTDSRMHYHGADGVYAGVTTEGTLKLYWGESKVYADPTAAIRDCLNSLSPFLIEPEHEEAGRERDLMLLSDKADLSNPVLTDALKKYFDKSSVMSKRVQYCGVLGRQHGRHDDGERWSACARQAWEQGATGSLSGHRAHRQETPRSRVDDGGPGALLPA